LTHWCSGVPAISISPLRSMNEATSRRRLGAELPSPHASEWKRQLPSPGCDLTRAPVSSVVEPSLGSPPIPVALRSSASGWLSRSLR
jgi:hypothetical protein